MVRQVVVLLLVVYHLVSTVQLVAGQLQILHHLHDLSFLLDVHLVRHTVYTVRYDWWSGELEVCQRPV